MPRARPSTIAPPMNYLRTATALVAVIAAARAGGWAADRLGQPRVLGELAAGLLLGNLSLMRFVGLEFLKTDPFVDGVSRIAVIVLMFHASLESTVGEMRKLGVAALAVAVCGVAGSLVATWMVARWLLASSAPFTQAFVA